MASLTNQQSNTKSLTGLSDTYSSNIVCDTFEVSNEFTIDNGCIVNIPANSIPDSALSTNVALKNGANIFTNTNTFNDTVTISRTGSQLFIRDPANVGPSTITQTGSSLNISSVCNNSTPQTSMVLSTRSTTNGGCVLFNGNSTILNLGTNSLSTTIVSPTLNLSATSLVYPTGGTAISGGVLTYANNLVNNGTVTNNGILTNNSTINDHATRNQYNEDRFVDVTNPLGQATQIFQNGGGLVISNIGNLQNINLNTRDTFGTVLANIICRNGNRIQLQGTSAGEIDITNNIVTLSGVCSFTNVTTPLITQAISLVDNSTKIATTAYVKGQNYITTAALVGYAQLAATQTFTGINTFALSGGQVQLNAGALYTDVGGGASSTFINQNGVACQIHNNHNLGSIRLSTKNSGGVPQDNVYALNGNQGGLQGDSGNTIEIVGTQATIGGDSVPKIKTQPLTASNTNEIASTAFVKNQGYAKLAGTQTFTGTNTFALSGAEVEFNGGSIYMDLLGGSSSTLMNQTDIDCHIENTHDNGSIRLRTRSLTGIPIDNIFAINGNIGGLQGDPNISSSNVIMIVGTQATIGGTSVPKITTQPLTASNTNEIASTKFVKDQLYATTASLSAYALLMADQTFTGTQTCVAANNILPIKIQTQLVGYTAYSGGSVICDAGAYNGINVNAGNYSVIAFGTGINTGGVLTLTTHSSTNCGILITNTEITQTVPFTCGYLQLFVPVTTKTNYQMGFINTILYAGFTGNAWATSSGPYNIMSIAWNGTGDYTLGVWNVEIVIISQCTSAPTISFTWNTLTATSMTLNLHSGCVSDIGAYAGVGASIFRMSFILSVTDLLKSYFLNCSRVGGAGLSSDSNSYIKFTRLA